MAAVVHPPSVLRRLFGDGPFVEHVPLGIVQLFVHFGGGGIDRKFQAVTARVKEVDRLEYRVVGRAQHMDPIGFKLGLCLQHFFHALHLQRKVLGPLGRVHVPTHRGLGGQFKEGQHIAAPCVQEDMHIGIRLLGGGDFVFGNGQNEVHVQVFLIPLNRLLGILAAIGYMVDLLDFDG